MPQQGHITTRDWRYYPADGDGTGDHGRGMLRQRQYTHRATDETMHMMPAMMRHQMDGQVERNAPHARTPPTFIISSSKEFEWAVYLTLTNPLRELGA